jgi:hypothetical protein
VLKNSEPIVRLLSQKSFHRNALFVMTFVVWVVAFVLIFRQRWLETSRTNVLRGITTETAETLNSIDSKTDFWASMSTKIASQVASSSPATRGKPVLASQKDFLETQDEWVATHVYRNKKGSQPNLLMTLLSRKAMLSVTGDKEFSVPWPDEAQLASLRLVSNFKSPPMNRLGVIRGFNKGSSWTQLAQRRRSANRADGDIWVVHTFNEKFLPFVNAENSKFEFAILNPDNKEFILSRNFSQLKIESNELLSFIEAQKANSGIAEQKFLSNRKHFWLSWTKSKRWILLQVSPHQKINNLVSAPPFYQDWLILSSWLLGSCFLVLYSLKKWFWENAEAPIEAGAAASFFAPTRNDNTKAPHSSAEPTDPEKEFCRHLLTDVGPIGELKLAGSARAKIEVASAGAYKGSWWLLENIDEHRICVAVGDASGKGLAAGTAAFSTRHAVERCLKSELKTEDSETLLSKLFTAATQATESVLAGTHHGSIFIAVIDVATQKVVFINAGYPSPLLTSGAGQKILLNSSHDPMGLATDPDFSPRWVNITVGTEIVLCNVGSRNTDLPELDDSELLKIFIYPLGFIPKSQAPMNSVFEAVEGNKAA